MRTIRDACVGEGRYVRQAGCPGKYAHVIIRLTPCASRGFTYEWAVAEDLIPREFELATFRGIRMAAARNSLTAIHVTVTGGSYDEKDSSILWFKVAGFIALEDALARAVVVETG